MKNYVNEAQKHGININLNYYFRDDYVANYTLYRDNNYVEIKYIDGRSETKEIESDTITKLDAALADTLKIYCCEIVPKIENETRWKKGIVALDLLNTSIQFATQHLLSGFCWLTCAGLFYLQVHGPLKLKREMQLVSWIYDNKEKVNEVIREEVLSLVPETEIDCESNNPKIQNYSRYVTRYPEEMYYDGINLSNISSLGLKDLRKLKTKVKRKVK